MIETPSWYRDTEARIEKLEETLANLYTQVQSMDSEILLLQTEIKELKDGDG